jgi:hypothetical protein
MKLCRFIFALLIASVAVVPQRALAALNAAIVFEVRTTGSDTNSGGFKTGATGTDWSQQDAAQYSVTDGVTAGTTTITSATANFGTDVVGNVMYVQGGTGSVTAGWYEIISRTNSTTIVVDRSTGLTSGTGVTLKIGGALATLNAVVPIAVSSGSSNNPAIPSNKVYVKSGTYTTSTAITFTQAQIYIEGYGATRGDLGTKPVIKATAGSITILSFTTANQGATLRNVELDGDSQTSVNGLAVGGGSPTLIVDRVVARNCPGTAFTGASGGIEFHRCYAVSSGVGFNAFTCFGCEAASCTGNGFTVGFVTGATLMTCLARGNGGDGFNVAAAAASVYGCTARGNTGDGFDLGSRRISATNDLSYGNGAWGFTGSFYAWNCAAGSNTSGNFNTAVVNYNSVTLTADPHASSTNLSLNNTAGGGAACRAAGIPGAFPGGLTTGYLDIGAVQHQDSGGAAGGPVIRSSGGRLAP